MKHQALFLSQIYVYDYRYSEPIDINTDIPQPDTVSVYIITLNR